MAQKPQFSTVVSTLCTHVVHELELELTADVPTAIPTEHLARVLELPGVVLTPPRPAPTTEPQHLED